MNTYYISKYETNGFYQYKETKQYRAKDEKSAFIQALGNLSRDSVIVESPTMGKYVWNKLSGRIEAIIERIDDETGKIIYMAHYSNE